jgi:nitrogen fixation-related uncharacterized protein
MTIGTSIVLIAIGAILKWAVTVSTSGFNIQTAGTVLIIVGAIGLVLSLLYTFVWSRRGPYYDDPRDPGYPPRRTPPPSH